MPDTFVSYSRRNKEFVRKLVDALQDNDHTVWIDWENIPLTADWMKEIEAGIEAANNFIFVISPDSVRSEVCLQEVEHAVQHNKRFVPILHEELVLAEDKEMLHPSISSHNWIFIRDEDDFDAEIKALIEALETDLTYVKSHTRLLTRALEWDNRGRDSSFLLRGSDLKDAESTLAKSEAGQTPTCTPLQIEYLNASQQNERWRKRERFLMGVITLAFISTLIALGVAFWQFIEAESQRAIAQQLSLAANSQVALTNDNRDLAIALSLAATDGSGDTITARAETERALSDAAYSAGTRLVFDEHETTVRSIAFSQDGLLALSGDDLGVIRLWNVFTGDQLLTYEGHEASVNDIVFSPDEMTAASASNDGTIRIWDVESGIELMVLDEHSGPVTSLDFNEDGSLLISGSTDTTVRVWDIATGESLFTLAGHEGRVLDVVFHPDGVRALSLAVDTSPILWNIETGEEDRRFDEQKPTGINLDVGSIDISPDGSRVLSSYGLDLHLWDLETGVTIRAFTGHGSYINSIAFSPDGRSAISSARRENSVRVWNINSGEELYRFEGHAGIVQAVTISPDGRYALSSAEDATVRIWELANGALIDSFMGPTDDIFSVDYAPDGGSVIASGNDPIIYQIDLVTGEVIRTFEGHNERVWSIMFSPDGENIFSGGNEASVLMWDVATGETIRIFEGHESTITTLDISPDGTTLATGSNDRTVRLWNIETGEQIQLFDEDDGQLRSVAFNYDGTQLVAGAGNTGAGSARIIDLATGEVLQYLTGHADRVNTATFSPDGSLVATGSGDGSIRIWETATGTTLQIFEGHTGQVRSVLFTQDGTRLLSSSADATLRLWDIETGLEVRRLEGHREWINQAVFSPDGQFAISGAWDETIRLWHMHDLQGIIDWTKENRYIRDLTCGERQIYLVDASRTCATLD